MLDLPRPTSLLADDGVRIEAVHVPAGGGRRQPGAPAGGRSELGFVLAHGFTGSWRRPTVWQIVEWLSEFGGVVAFDFRGHGGSGGRSTVGDREVLDLDAAVRWARWLGYPKVVTFGWSMGASVAVRHAALHHEIDAVVAVSGPARWYYRGTRPMRLLHHGVERPLGRFVLRHAFGTRVGSTPWDPIPESPTEAAPRIAPTPLLVVHGDSDHYFPVEHAHALYLAAREPKALWIEPGFGHAEGGATRDLVARIAGQVSSWLEVSACPPR